MSGILGIFLSPIFIPIYLIWGVIAGIFLGMMLAKPRKNTVMKLEPNSSRAFDFQVEKENAVTLECKPFPGLPLQRFLKVFDGLTVLVQGWTGRPQTITRWLAREGTAFTKRLARGDPVPPAELFTEPGREESANPVLSPIPGVRWLERLVPLSNTVQTIWGTEFWESVPEAKRQELEAGKISVTIMLNPDGSPLKDKEGKPVEYSEEAVFDEQDRQAAKIYFDGKKSSDRGGTLNLIMALGAGAAIGLVASLFLGWIPVYKPPANTGQAILVLVQQVMD